jgi:hypothetical protein
MESVGGFNMMHVSTRQTRLNLAGHQKRNINKHIPIEAAASNNVHYSACVGRLMGVCVCAIEQSAALLHALNIWQKVVKPNGGIRSSARTRGPLMLQNFLIPSNRLHRVLLRRLARNRGASLLNFSRHIKLLQNK